MKSLSLLMAIFEEMVLVCLFRGHCCASTLIFAASKISCASAAQRRATEMLSVAWKALSFSRRRAEA
jgi:hypothetical protein